MPPEVRLDGLLDTLEAHLSTLERYAREISKDVFIRSEDEQNKVLFGMHKAIQTAIDAAVVVSRRGLGRGETYRDLFETLVGARVLDRDLDDRMAGWAGLRNVIVHIYRIIDLDRIHRAYSAETDDLRELVAALRVLPEC